MITEKVTYNVPLYKVATATASEHPGRLHTRFTQSFGALDHVTVLVDTVLMV
jgi:hypothetical protein